MLKYYIELETPKKATPAETMLLYALGEELVLTKQWCENFSRISTDIIRVEITAGDNQKDALCRIYNTLRCSKNYMAHVCFVTIVDIAAC